MRVAEPVASKLVLAGLTLALVPSVAVAQLGGLSEPGEVIDDFVNELNGIVDGDEGASEEAPDDRSEASNAGGANGDGGLSGGANGDRGNIGGGVADGGPGGGLPLLDPRTTDAIGPGMAHVCFYALPNFEGESLCLHAGNGLMPLLGDWADRISSIEVIGQALALVCDGTNLTGICQIVTESMPTVFTKILSLQVL
jgi:hypothetical protein